MGDLLSDLQARKSAYNKKYGGVQNNAPSPTPAPPPSNPMQSNGDTGNIEKDFNGAMNAMVKRQASLTGSK